MVSFRMNKDKVWESSYKEFSPILRKELNTGLLKIFYYDIICLINLGMVLWIVLNTEFSIKYFIISCCNFALVFIVYRETIKEFKEVYETFKIYSRYISERRVDFYNYTVERGTFLKDFLELYFWKGEYSSRVRKEIKYSDIESIELFEDGFAFMIKRDRLVDLCGLEEWALDFTRCVVVHEKFYEGYDYRKFKEFLEKQGIEALDLKEMNEKMGFV